MELRALCRDDDGVSSVLGVVLMVAVTIILAAVIGTFVLGIGSELTDSSPSASWEFSENVNDSAGGQSDVVVLHGGGDDVDPSNLEVTVDGETVYRNGNTVNPSNYTVRDSNFDDPVTTGDRLVINDSGYDLQSGDMVRLIWNNGDSSGILAEERLG